MLLNNETKTNQALRTELHVKQRLLSQTDIHLERALLRERSNMSTLAMESTDRIVGLKDALATRDHMLLEQTEYITVLEQKLQHANDAMGRRTVERTAAATAAAMAVQRTAAARTTATTATTTAPALLTRPVTKADHGTQEHSHKDGPDDPEERDRLASEGTLFTEKKPSVVTINGIMRKAKAKTSESFWERGAVVAVAPSMDIVQEQENTATEAVAADVPTKTAVNQPIVPKDNAGMEQKPNSGGKLTLSSRPRAQSGMPSDAIGDRLHSDRMSVRGIKGIVQHRKANSDYTEGSIVATPSQLPQSSQSSQVPSQPSQPSLSSPIVQVPDAYVQRNVNSSSPRVHRNSIKIVNPARAEESVAEVPVAVTRPEPLQPASQPSPLSPIVHVPDAHVQRNVDSSSPRVHRNSIKIVNPAIVQVPDAQVKQSHHLPPDVVSPRVHRNSITLVNTHDAAVSPFPTTAAFAASAASAVSAVSSSSSSSPQRKRPKRRPSLKGIDRPTSPPPMPPPPVLPIPPPSLPYGVPPRPPDLPLPPAPAMGSLPPPPVLSSVLPPAPTTRLPPRPPGSAPDMHAIPGPSPPSLPPPPLPPGREYSE
jgi:hypothetical protein